QKEWELRQDNPCLGVKRFPEKKRERFLRDEELRRLGEAIGKAEMAGAVPKSCLDAVRLLALTRCRLSEVLNLTWQQVDLEHGALRLLEGKTGARTVPLSLPSMELLRLREREGVYVFPVLFDDRPMTRYAFHHYWMKLVKSADIHNARPHDLRHTAGTYAALAGFNAFLVRDFLGHKTIAMSSRYVEKVTDPLAATANAVASRINAALTSTGAEVIPMEKVDRG
ncbi:MAG: site-specific integrase, partial [Acidobacteria bacterium]|nr:site-specific integrase [Acidobacteriota bacterium]